MGKDKSKNLVGQPLFKQIVKMLPKDEFDLLVSKCGSDRYYKTLFSWEQLIVMLFGIFSRYDSMGEVCDGMRARIHLISHLELAWVVTEGRRAYTKRGKSRNKSPTAIQLSLF